MSTYIDCHLHLQDERLAGRVNDVLARARNQGVRRFICNGSNESDWNDVRRLACEHADIHPCFGLHPWYVSQRSRHWLDLLESFLNSTTSGIGEIGLDRILKDSDESDQEQVLRQQLALARRLNRTVSIHSARAAGWLLDVLKNEKSLPDRLHLHAFGGSAELARQFVKLGACFSFAGNAFYTGRKKLHETIRAVPPERLLSETDCPDIPPPDDLRLSQLYDDTGKPLSEPGNLPGMVRLLAEIRRENATELADLIRENTERFFIDLTKEQNRE